MKIYGNNVEIWDYRGNISMVHITDVKRTTLMEQVADEYEYEQLDKLGRFTNKCIPKATSQTLTGQQYTKTQTNPSGQ